MKPTIEEIREILKIFLESELQELHLEIEDVRLAVSKTGAHPTAFAPRAPHADAAATAAASAEATAPAAATAPASAPAAPAVDAAAPARNGWVAINAPSVGVFYRRPAPDQPPFVQVGDRVEQDAPLCLIEVMKMYTRVTAPCRGRLAEILVEDGQLAEYGQTLMLIDPA